MELSPVISVENVTQRFRVIHERPDTLREIFAKIYRHKSKFHDFEALKDISFQVRPGEMVGIIGRDGSGKSALLKLIGGVYVPSSGRIQVRGSIAPLIELGAGFHHELTGRENILLNGLLLGLSRRDIQEREESIIEFAELGDFIDAPVKQYSSGMYMRLAFAVATEVDPDILLIDEILAVGDSAFQEKCFERIRQFRASGKTILYVSHDVSSVKKFCDRALLVHNGELRQAGPPEPVIAAYQDLL